MGIGAVPNRAVMGHSHAPKAQDTGAIRCGHDR